MSNYTELQQSVLEYIKDTALTSTDAQMFIADAEPKLERDLLSQDYGSGACYHMLGSLDATVDLDGLVNLPSDFISARSVYVGGKRARYASPDLVPDVVGADTGFANAQAKIDYYKRLPVLSAQVATNWLLDVAFDLYRWGACVQYAAWGKKVDAAQVWLSYYKDAMITVRAAYKAAPRGGLYKHSNKAYGAFYTNIGTTMRFWSPRV